MLRLSLATLALSFLLTACGGGGDGSSSSSASAPRQAAFERCDDARVQRLREHLDLLREDEARESFREIGPFLEDLCGVESYLLRARMHGMLGDLTKAQPLIEEARAAAPDDPRVYATAAELYAGPGQLDTASREIQEGIENCGATPELIRAQGVLHICTGSPTSAERGLKRLQRAKEEDPALPFMQKPLGQAHLLVARQSLAAGDAERALLNVRDSLEYDPSEADSWHFLSEVHAALGEHEKAVKVLEKLIDMGRPLTGELALTCKNAGTAALVELDRPKALEYFMKARELGLSQEELGFGLQALRDAAQKCVEEGLAKFQEYEYVEARERFEQALVFDPEDLAARNHLGLVHFKTSNYDAAVEAWRTVIAQAAELEVTLPEPVHIHLAKALLREGDNEGARLALSEYLLDEPFGDYVDETRDMLAGVPEEE